MGKFDFELSVEFMKSLGRLADVDRVAPKMIEEALPICAQTLKSEFEARSHIDPSLDPTAGLMVASIKPGKVTHLRNGGFKGVARPYGKDSKGVRNMEKLAYYEYGTYGGQRQPPRPIIDKVKNDCSQACQESMRNTFEREMGIK